MSKLDPAAIQASLDSIYAAERTLRELTDQVERAPKACEVAEKAIADARKQADEDERGLRLTCLTRILRGIKDPKALDLLIDVLGDDTDEGRASAGIALEDVGMDRAADLHAAIARALKTLPANHHALRELPFVLLSVSEGDARRALVPFLALSDPEAVASAIEALVENADPAAIENISPLKKDTRTVDLEDESTGESTQITIAEMASDAVEALEEAKRLLAKAAG
ncbi:MAG: hypothetical protein HY898_29670 [Deltaproteobacteria bacterium]|nr:hypothetical protein [Deltaproteobacteria bacterium]